jgi:Protein of unknown function (DUF3551)
MSAHRETVGSKTQSPGRKRQMTRFLFLALLMTAPAAAQPSTAQYPFCIHGADNPRWSGYSFNTLQACQASASGTGSECISNPWYEPDPSQAPVSDGSQIGAFAPIPVGPPPN